MRTVFFCGERSRYGLAHVEPILASRLDVRLIVLADEERWSLFRTALVGDSVSYARIPPRLRLRRLVGRATGWHALRARRADVGRKVRRAAATRGIPVRTVGDVNAVNFVQELCTFEPEVILSAAYPQIFRRGLLGTAPGACVNFHPSALPRFRGAHPHFWSIVRNEPEGGVTAHYMTSRLDRGDILAQRRFPIADLTYSQHYARILAETPPLVAEVTDRLVHGDAQATPQDDSRACSFRNDREIHHRVFWNLHAGTEIAALVRAEVAFCTFRGRRIDLVAAWAAHTNRNLTNDVRVEPGTIVDLRPDLVVIKTLDGCLELRGLREDGRPTQLARWLRRRRVTIGDRFE